MKRPKIEYKTTRNNLHYVHWGDADKLEKYADWLETERDLEILAKDDLQERNELQFKEIKELEELLVRILELHPDLDEYEKDDYIEGAYDVLIDIKQALKK